MSLVADTGGLYALYDADDAHHTAVRGILQKEPGPIIVPSAILGELDVPLHIHIHETEEEVERSISEHGMRPLERLGRLGLLGPNLLAVHSVHLTAPEIQLLARHGASAVHCPSSNLKLASGFAPVARLLAAGVNVALGTDGAASNNRLDVMQEMRQAALLAKAVARDAAAMPAHVALRCATPGR